MNWMDQTLSKAAMRKYKEETLKMATLMMDDDLTFTEAMLLVKGGLEEAKLMRIYYLAEYWIKGVYDGKS